VLAAFAPLFSEPSWLRVQALGCGTLLAPATHTLTAARRALGLAQEPGFQNYHRVLNRARWSARQAAGVRLGLLAGSLGARGVGGPGAAMSYWNAVAAASSAAWASTTTRCIAAKAVFRRAAPYAGGALRADRLAVDRPRTGGPPDSARLPAALVARWRPPSKRPASRGASTASANGRI
jgi:hypothetical protein